MGVIWCLKIRLFLTGSLKELKNLLSVRPWPVGRALNFWQDISHEGRAFIPLAGALRLTLLPTMNAKPVSLWSCLNVIIKSVYTFL